MSEDTFRQILDGDPDLFDENFDSLAAFLDQIKANKNTNTEQQ